MNALSDELCKLAWIMLSKRNWCREIILQNLTSQKLAMEILGMFQNKMNQSTFDYVKLYIR